AFIPEILYPNIKQLQDNYLKIINDPDFQKTFRDLLKNYVGRPTPLYFASNLSRAIGSNIYLKREDLNHTGAHKINNALGQVLLARRLGKTRIIAETGAGQHGVAVATACALFNMPCFIYMGELDTHRQAANVKRIEALGAKVISVRSGSRVLKDAGNEAMRDWIANPADTHYVIGSAIGPHPFPDMVARFQSVISNEIKSQIKADYGIDKPDKVIACIGGGSNAIGAYYSFIEDTAVELIGVEAAGEGVSSGKTAATLSAGTAGIMHGSRTLLLQTPDGQIVEAHSVSAGLDYPAVGPQHAYLKESGRVKYISVTDEQALEAGLMLTRTEGIIPALESAHALAALKKLAFKPEENVIICLSGRGDKDMPAYLKHIQKGGFND
ncbi:MAG: tryptophan synthase subunit beta, partial [Candidatus Dadabacteria bacterium]